MNNSVKRTVVFLAWGAALGVVGDLLFQNVDKVGINAVLGLVVLLAAGWRIARTLGITAGGNGCRLAIPAVIFATCLAWRDSPTLRTLDVWAITISLSMGAAYWTAGKVQRTNVLDLALSQMYACFAVVTRTFYMIACTEWASSTPTPPWRGRLAPIARGLALAAPLLLLFGGLFMQADPVFAHLIFRLFDWDIAAFCVRAGWIGVIAWCATGYLSYALAAGRPSSVDAHEEPRSGGFLGMIELGISLGLLDLLFLSFILVQIRYLFGGSALLRATIGMTFAEYARAGFFELATASGLVLPVLLLLHWASNRSDTATVALFRALAGVQIVLLFVVMGSALIRMHMYQEAFGLTELRIYTVAFMGWLALVFIWMSQTVLRGHGELFPFGTLTAAFTVIFCLHCVNPDNLIVRVNAERATQSHRFDACYVSSLSDDAVPALAAALPRLAPQGQAIVARRLLRSAPPSSIDWRAWNVGSAQAWNVVEQRIVAIRQATAGADVGCHGNR